MSEQKESPEVSGTPDRPDIQSVSQISSKLVTLRAAVGAVDAVRKFEAEGYLKTSGGELSVWFITDFGVITGHVMTDEEVEGLVHAGDGSNQAVNLAGILVRGRTSFLEQAEDEGIDLVPDGAFIVIKDAVIRFMARPPIAQDLFLSQPLILFTDAIKAVTWGDRNLW